jgi:hypothetical protein
MTILCDNVKLRKDQHSCFDYLSIRLCIPLSKKSEQRVVASAESIQAELGTFCIGRLREEQKIQPLSKHQLELSKRSH